MVFLLLPSYAQGCALRDKGVLPWPLRGHGSTPSSATRVRVASGSGVPNAIWEHTKPCQSTLCNHNAFAYIREDNESTSRTGKLAFWTVDK